MVLLPSRASIITAKNIARCMPEQPGRCPWSDSLKDSSSGLLYGGRHVGFGGGGGAGPPCQNTEEEVQSLGLVNFMTGLSQE
jgi:hypothetical protein